MHAMQQPIPMSTSTQTKISTILLTHYRSSVSYNQRGSDTKRCGTPARATGLPWIASPEIGSSGNTQHGTEITALLILVWYKGLILHRDSRPSGTHGAAGQYVHYLMNMDGSSITRNYAAAEERRSGTQWHRDTDVDTS